MGCCPICEASVNKCQCWKDWDRELQKYKRAYEVLRDGVTGLHMPHVSVDCNNCAIGRALNKAEKIIGE